MLQVSCMAMLFCFTLQLGCNIRKGKGSFRNVLNKFQLCGFSILILLSKPACLHGDWLKGSHIQFIRDSHIVVAAMWLLSTLAIQGAFLK